MNKVRATMVLLFVLVFCQHLYSDWYYTDDGCYLVSINVVDGVLEINVYDTGACTSGGWDYTGTGGEYFSAKCSNFGYSCAIRYFNCDACDYWYPYPQPYLVCRGRDESGHWWGFTTCANENHGRDSNDDCDWITSHHCHNLGCSGSGCHMYTRCAYWLGSCRCYVSGGSGGGGRDETVP